MDCFSDVSGVGIFSDSICVAGTVMLFYSADHCNCEGGTRGTAIVIAEEDSCLS